MNYPTQEWLDRWIDNYLDHTTEKITDFHELEEQAMTAWWDAEVDKGNPTPYDLTPEQEQESKKATKGAKAVNAYGKAVQRKRKENPAKREIISLLAKALTDAGYPAVVSNIEKTIDFEDFSINLTQHRKKA